MEYKTFKVEGSLVLDQYAKQQIKAAIGSKFVELDLSGLEGIDSSGIDLVVRLIRSTEEQGGAVRVVGTQAHVRDIMEICGLQKYVEFA